MSWLIISLLVIGRIAAASWANVLQKRAISSTLPLGTKPSALELLVATWTWMAIALAPWWLPAIGSTMTPLVGTSSSQLITSFYPPATSLRANLPIMFWAWMAVACLLEVPGNFLLLRSIQSTDLSIFGPLNSYKPVVGLFLGWLILAEIPSYMGLVGMGIVLVGSLLLSGGVRASEFPPSQKRYFLGMENRGVRDRLLAVALTAAGSVFLKLGMEGVNPITTLAAWSLMSWIFAAVWLLINSVIQRLPTIGRTVSLTKQREVILIAASMLLMQAATIVLFQQMAIGYALALFQLGSLLSVYLGYRLFGEADFIRRMIAAAIMVLGATIIMLAG